MKRPARLFISYAREDAELRKQFETHLAALQITGHVDVWSDSDLNPGDTWEEKTNAQLDAADIVVLLVSSDFYASHYAFEVETKRAVEREKQGKTRVIPVVVRACQFETTPLHKYHALPTNLQPVASWVDRDEAWNDVVDGIRRVVEGRPMTGSPAPSVHSSRASPMRRLWQLLLLAVLFGMGLVLALQGLPASPQREPTTSPSQALPAATVSIGDGALDASGPPVPTGTSSAVGGAGRRGPVSGTSVAPIVSPPEASAVPPNSAATTRYGTAVRTGETSWSLGVARVALGGAKYVLLLPSPAPSGLKGVQPTCSISTVGEGATCSRSDEAWRESIGDRVDWRLP